MSIVLGTLLVASVLGAIVIAVVVRAAWRRAGSEPETHEQVGSDD